MENFIVAIPSYQRADKQATLAYLKTIGVPKECIYIFVQTAKDKAAYSIHEQDANVILAAANGIAKARNNILRHFSGRNILMLDDDISGIDELRSGDFQTIGTKELFSKYIGRCFATAKKYGAPLFGLYPVHNAFFMSRTISTAVTVNTVLGFVGGTESIFDESYSAKEDLELCARHLSSGKPILRFNFLAPDAKHRTNKGGCHSLWHTTANQEAAERLCKEYPKIFAPKQNNPNEVRIILKDSGKINLGKKNGGDK